MIRRLRLASLLLMGIATIAHGQSDPYAGRINNGGIPLRLDQPRIAPVNESNWSDQQRELLEPLLRDRGLVPNVYGTFANHPQMYRPWIEFAGYILRRSTLPAREREMLICRIGWLANGEYEWSAHTPIGIRNGLTEDEIMGLAEGPESNAWSEIDSAIVRAVDELHADAFITDQTWSKLSGRFNTQQLMDVVLTVGAYNMLAQVLNSCGAQLQETMSGFPDRSSVADRSGGRRGRVSGQGGIPLRLHSPRIAPVREAAWNDEQRALLAPIKSARGSVPNIYLTMARHPKMFTPRLTFGRYIQRESTLPAREREMLICRIAWLTSAEYEWAAHTQIGLQSGLTDQEIARLAQGPSAEDWSAFDSALIRAADELHETSFISDPTWQVLSQRLDHRQLLDAIVTVGGYQMLAMALNSFGVQLQEGASGFLPSGTNE